VTRRPYSTQARRDCNRDREWQADRPALAPLPEDPRHAALREKARAAKKRVLEAARLAERQALAASNLAKGLTVACRCCARQYVKRDGAQDGFCCLLCRERGDAK
jgi:hypothetical protein